MESLTGEDEAGMVGRYFLCYTKEWNVTNKETEVE